MTREDALQALQRLAVGLEPDLAGCARLLERVSVHEEAEVLRDVLVELGVRVVLDDGPGCLGSSEETGRQRVEQRRSLLPLEGPTRRTTG